MAAERARKQLFGNGDKPEPEISRLDWDESLRDPLAFYGRCCRYFRSNLPQEFRDHRRYFTEAGRGFGEDAFHVLWFLIFREFKPVSFLEIGVYRGQSLTLGSFAARHFGIACDVFGISPFEAIGDSVSTYPEDVDYLPDTLANFEFFQLPKPTLLKACSNEPSGAALIRSRQWDVVYIDGNHDYEIAKEDWQVCAEMVRPGGVIVLDDSGLTTSYKPPAFAFGGHPGPSRLAQEIDPRQFREILQVGHNRAFLKLV
jgi:hypothetical protein